MPQSNTPAVFDVSWRAPQHWQAKRCALAVATVEHDIDEHHVVTKEQRANATSTPTPSSSGLGTGSPTPSESSASRSPSTPSSWVRTYCRSQPSTGCSRSRGGRSVGGTSPRSVAERAGRKHDDQSELAEASAELRAIWRHETTPSRWREALTAGGTTPCTGRPNPAPSGSRPAAESSGRGWPSTSFSCAASCCPRHLPGSAPATSSTAIGLPRRRKRDGGGRVTTWLQPAGSWRERGPGQTSGGCRNHAARVQQSSRLRRSSSGRLETRRSVAVGGESTDGACYGSATRRRAGGNGEPGLVRRRLGGGSTQVGRGEAYSLKLDYLAGGVLAAAAWMRSRVRGRSRPARSSGAGRHRGAPRSYGRSGRGTGAAGDQRRHFRKAPVSTPFQANGGITMAENRGVAYMGTGKVEVQNIDFPTFELQDGPGVNPANVGRKLPHAAILKIVSTNICGSDQHMVRGRTTAPAGLILGHEITGEVIETGPGVEFIKKGDLVLGALQHRVRALPHCARKGDTGVCLNVNPDRPGSAYGYVDMGGWVGGQAEYVMVPYADFNLLKFPDKEQAMEKILDLTMLSDIFPTGYHGAVHGGRRVGIDGVHRRRRPSRPCGRLLGPAARGGRRDRRRPDPGALGAGALDRVRDDRRLQGRPEGHDRADPRRARGRRRGRRRGLRGPRARLGRRPRGARHGAELDHGRSHGRPAGSESRGST